MRLTSRVVSAGLMAGLALVLAPASFGGQPVTQTLNPEPPSFYSCKAVGSGTICQGSTVEIVDPHPDFTCSDGTVIYDQGTVRRVARRVYNADGNLILRVIHESWSPAQKSNPLTGLTAPYTQSSIYTDVLAIPGDLSSATETATGQGNITIPGRGAVLLNVGRTITAPDGSVEFSAGQQGFLDYFLGNTDVVDELCAVLGAH